jgi:hypothetical protein
MSAPRVAVAAATFFSASALRRPHGAKRTPSTPTSHLAVAAVKGDRGDEASDGHLSPLYYW